MNRVAIVTGGTRGIGLGITRAFLADGVDVVAVFVSDSAAADRLTEAESAREGSDDPKKPTDDAPRGALVTVQADVGVSSEAKRVVGLAIERFGRLDYLINNAAISDFRFLDEMEESFLDEMIRVNLKAPILMIQAALPQMKRQRFGRIVNASSISGHYADVAQVAYGSTKAGVEMTTKLAAAELGPYGITVNAYAPGIIETDMTREMIADRGDVQLRQIPAGRFGAVEDAAALVLFLCGESAGYITGEIIGVDGGMLRAQNPFRAIERAQR
jgi:3-oxoacyl-[acyl-carrier protein] reductase